MRGIWLAFGAVWLAGAAAADQRLTVTLPDVSDLTPGEARQLMAQLAEVNVITSNCADWTVDDATWALLTGTGDMLAMRMGVDPAAYDDMYFGPAFALLSDPTACDRIGPKAQPLIARLQAMGARLPTRSAGTGSDSAEDRAPGQQTAGVGGPGAPGGEAAGDRAPGGGDGPDGGEAGD